MVTVEVLYKYFGVLADAKEKAGEHEAEYLAILEAVKGGPSEKRLASQFIARFFKYFPNCAEKALDAQFDLCEDDDVTIRKQAIKDLPSLCRGALEHVPKISNVLTQLLQSDDNTELSLVQCSLITLLKVDPKGTLGGIFTQILQGEDIIRERAIKFLKNKMVTLDDDLWTKDVEDFVIAETRKVLQDVTGDEFMAFMKILSSLKSMKTMQGRQQMVEIVAEQADLDKEFDASDPDVVDRLIQCLKQVVPLFSKNVHSTRFFVYMCDNVLPVLNEVTGSEEDDGQQGALDIQLEILKLFAEMSEHCGQIEKVEERANVIYNTLIEFMPLPPSEENLENTDSNTEPKLLFSHVECLMYAFHQVAGKCPQILAAEQNAERLKDFRLRLQYLARGVQLYIKQLRMALQGKTGEALKSEEDKIKIVALRTTNNINTLIKDLFRNPPSYKASVTLSFKPLGSKATGAANSGAAKRPGITPITFQSGDETTKAKKGRGTEIPIYSPPAGKFSEKAGQFTGTRGRGRGRGYGSRGNRGWAGRGFRRF